MYNQFLAQSISFQLPIAHEVFYALLDVVHQHWTDRFGHNFPISRDLRYTFFAGVQKEPTLVGAIKYKQFVCYTGKNQAGDETVDTSQTLILSWNVLPDSGKSPIVVMLDYVHPAVIDYAKFILEEICLAWPEVRPLITTQIGDKFQALDGLDLERVLRMDAAERSAKAKQASAEATKNRESFLAVTERGQQIEELCKSLTVADVDGAVMWALQYLDPESVAFRREEAGYNVFYTLEDRASGSVMGRYRILARPGGGVEQRMNWLDKGPLRDEWYNAIMSMIYHQIERVAGEKRAAVSANDQKTAMEPDGSDDLRVTPAGLAGSGGLVHVSLNHTTGPLEPGIYQTNEIGRHIVEAGNSIGALAAMNFAGPARQQMQGPVAPPTKPAGRRPDEKYDKAYQIILESGDEAKAYAWYCAQLSYTPDKVTRDSFKKAMKRRQEKTK